MDKNPQDIKIGERSLADLSPMELMRLDAALAEFVAFLLSLDSQSDRQTADNGANSVKPVYKGPRDDVVTDNVEKLKFKTEEED